MKLWHGIGLVIGILLLIGGSLALILQDNPPYAPGEATAEEELFLEIVSVTSPIGKGYTATLRAKTVPEAYCTITVYYKSGPSSASGLHGKTADNDGNVSWPWKVGTRTTPGSWRIVVTATLDDETISQTTYFTVY